MYTNIQPVVQPVFQPVLKPVVLRKRDIKVRRFLFRTSASLLRRPIRRSVTVGSFDRQWSRCWVDLEELSAFLTKIVSIAHTTGIDHYAHCNVALRRDACIGIVPSFPNYVAILPITS